LPVEGVRDQEVLMGRMMSIIRSDLAFASLPFLGLATAR
jgi:hypothetical protein